MTSILGSLNAYFGSVPDRIRPWRWSILGSILVISAAMLWGLMTRMEIDATIDSWFSDGDPVIEALDDFRRQFGSDDGLFLVYEAKDGDVFSPASLAATRALVARFENPELRLDPDYELLDHIKRVQAITNTRIQINRDDTLYSELLIPIDIPTDAASLDAIKARANNAQNLKLFMYSENYRYGAISIQTNFGTIPKAGTQQLALADSSSTDFGLDGDDSLLADDLVFDSAVDDAVAPAIVEFEDTDTTAYVAFSQAINKVIYAPEFSDHFTFYPVGSTALVDLTIDTMVQAGLLLLLMIVIVIGLLWTLFHSASAVIWSVLAIVISNLWVVGGAVWLGYSVSQMVSLTVMLVLAVGIADCVHVMSTYLYYRRKDYDHESAMRTSYSKVGVPILLTSITTMAGMMALTINAMSQFQFFGIVSALGVGMAFLFTVYFLPILMDLWHPQIHPKTPKTRTGFVRIITAPMRLLSWANKASGLKWLLSAVWLQPLLDKIPNFVAKRPVTISAIFLVVFIATLMGMTKVRIDTNLVELFKDDTPLAKAYTIVDKEMMGTGSMEVMIKMGQSDALTDPEVLKAIEALQTTLETKYGDYVLRTYSLADLVKDTNRIMFDDRPELAIIPDDQQAVNQLLFLFNNANPKDRSALVSDDYSQTHISVGLKNVGSYEYSLFFDDMKTDIDDAFGGLEVKYPELNANVTGTMAMIMRLSDQLSVQQFKSLAFALLIISAIMVVTLGSVQAGLLSIIPNLIPATLTFGIMGWFGVPLDTDTLMIAPVIIGIAVDDTIHFITHYRMAMVEHRDMNRALKSAISEVGQAVTFTTLILGCGFFMLTFSDYLGLAKMGGFGALAIFVALLCDLLLLPALIMIFKPRFGQKDIIEINTDVKEGVS
jgi:predicted RND superfamily exporter protein